MSGFRPAKCLALLVALAAAGCGASPSPNLYALAAQPGPAVRSRAMSVELRRIGLAGYLDRPEIIRGTVQYRLQVRDLERWGEPLGGMVERVLTEDLVGRLPQAAVFNESGAISTHPDAVMEIDIQRLDADPSGQVVLLAQVAVRPDGKTATATTIRLSVPLADDSTQAHVAAMSTALGLLADRLSERITSM